MKKTYSISFFKEVEEELLKLKDDKEAKSLSRFFKTGPGQYGEGDKFLGIKVPVTRNIVSRYKDSVNIDTAVRLAESEWHEIRLAGFLFLIELFNKHRKGKDLYSMKKIVDTYISLLSRGNNWDLVDLVAPKILGIWISEHPEDEKVLFALADKSDSLWHQRVAIVSTLELIRRGKFDITLKIARKFLTHKHDLIHKATGWMLREMGKRGGMEELKVFLEENIDIMPRTMLRYSIEKFEEPLRIYYLRLRRD